MYFSVNVSHKPVCVVRRPKLSGLGLHYGLALPGGKVVDFSQGGVRMISPDVFAAGHDVETVRVVDRAKYPIVRERLRQAFAASPHYQLVGSNCEDFANWLSGENAISGQVVAAGLAAIALAAVL